MVDLRTQNEWQLGYPLLIEMLAFHIGKSDAEKKSNELKLAFIRELRDSLNGSSFAQ